MSRDQVAGHGSSETRPSGVTMPARSSSGASGSGSSPTSAAASATSRRTFSSTVARPAASSSAAAYCAATRSTSCSLSTSARAASPIRAATPGSASRASAAASAPTSSSPPGGTFSATSSGSSANQPTSETTSGLPSESARIALPEVSPIVGARSSTHRVAGRHQRPQPRLLDVRLADHALRRDPDPLQPPGEVEAGRLRADEQQPRARLRPRSSANARRSCGIRLLSFRWPKQPIERRALDRGRLDRGRRPGRVRDPPQRPLVAVRARPLLDVARVDDQAGGAVEHLAGERELLGTAPPRAAARAPRARRSRAAAPARRPPAPSRRGTRARPCGRS